jgi:hypothetical protein
MGSRMQTIPPRRARVPRQHAAGKEAKTGGGRSTKNAVPTADEVRLTLMAAAFTVCTAALQLASAVMNTRH